MKGMLAIYCMNQPHDNEILERGVRNPLLLFLQQHGASFTNLQGTAHLPTLKNFSQKRENKFQMPGDGPELVHREPIGLAG